MSILDDAQRLTAAGRRDDAVALIAAASEAGDAEAMFAVANWRLFGLHGDRDIAEAHRLFERAGDAGYVEAIRTRATLIGNGTGCEADPDRAAELLATIRAVDAYADRQLTFSAQMVESETLSPMSGEVLSTQPSIRLVRQVLTTAECGYLTTLAAPMLQPSFVTDPRTGQRMPHPARTSMGMSFGPTQEDRVVARINARIARVSGTAAACGEPLHILRYTPGQEYRPHTDALPGEANQRDWTVLVYLNDGYDGGETLFDIAGVEWAGKQGDALIFCNVDADGNADPATRHAGLAVTSGTKWLATRWIRRRPYRP